MERERERVAPKESAEGGSKSKTTRRKLTPEQIKEIGELRAAGYTYSVVAKKVGCSVRSVERHAKDFSKSSIAADVKQAIVADLVEQTGTKQLQRDLMMLTANRLAVSKKLLEAIDLLTAKLLHVISDATVLDLAGHALTIQKCTAAHLALTKQTDLAIDRSNIAQSDEHTTSIVITEMTAEQVEEAQRAATARAGHAPEPELVLGDTSATTDASAESAGMQVGTT